jgi:phosphate:Na+ symporter
MSGTGVLINLLGGVALLLWGLHMVRTGVTRAYGSAIRTFLGRSLDHRVKAFGAGLAVTLVLQSSTATSLLAASFAGRGLVATMPALAVLLGADLGTSLVAQILSFDLSLLSPILLVVGIVLFERFTAGRTRNLGRICLGLGQMLLALKLIVLATGPMRSGEIVHTLLASLDGEPVLALLIGALITWMAHSSLAVVLLVISLSASGIVPVHVALALVLGANLGTALPPIVSTLGMSVEARRPPLGNFLFRLTGCVIVLPLLAWVSRWLPLIEADPARQIANFHTGFNLFLALLFLPLVHVMGTLTARILPETSEEEADLGPRHLDRSALETPPIALANAARETVRMGDVIEGMFRDCFEAMRTRDRMLIKRVEHTDDLVDDFHGAIMRYLTEFSREPLEEEDSRRCTNNMTFSTNLEHVGDIIVLNLGELVRNTIKKNVRFAEEDLADLDRLSNQIRENLRLAFGVFISGDLDGARRLLAEKTAYRDMEIAAVEAHMERIRDGRAQLGEASSIYLDLLRDLRRINSHLTSAAYPILDAAGQLRPSRLKKKKRVGKTEEPPRENGGEDPEVPPTPPTAAAS